MVSQNPPNSGKSDSEWSAMSEGEKAILLDTQRRMGVMEQQLISERVQKEDAQLKTRYQDYAPDIVDTKITKVLKGQDMISREDVWKAINFEKSVNNAYELGKKDGQVVINDKVNSTSTDGYTMTSPNDKPQPMKGENDKAFFRRLVEFNMVNSKK